MWQHCLAQALTTCTPALQPCTITSGARAAACCALCGPNCQRGCWSCPFTAFAPGMAVHSGNLQVRPCRTLSEHFSLSPQCSQIPSYFGPCYAELPDEDSDVSMPALCSAALDPSAVLVESGRSQQQVLLVTTGKGDLSVFRDGQQAGAHMLSAAWLGWPIRRPAGDAVLWCAYRAPTWQAHTARKCFTADVVELPAASCVELL